MINLPESSLDIVTVRGLAIFGLAVPNNVLVTGPPRSGKTTAVERARDRLAERGFVAVGVRAPAVREDGERVGFDLVAIGADARGPMARVDRDSGPRIGKYRVDVAVVDRVIERALDVPDADYLLVDEIAPMETASDDFVRRVRAALDATRPLLATVQAGDSGFVGAVHTREDATWFEVTPANRDALPVRLVDAVADRCAG